MKLEIITKNVNETEAAGAAFAKTLAPSTVVAMYGDLGAGKTAFVRGMAVGLGSGSRVTSPTFTIVNEYEGKLPIFHFDMYRLSSAVCVVEWSENVVDAFDGSETRVTIDKISENERKITVEVAEQ